MPILKIDKINSIKAAVKRTLINPDVFRQHHKDIAKQVAKFNWIKDDITEHTLKYCCGYVLAKLHKKMSKHENSVSVLVFAGEGVENF